jgi:hypothetical protein
MTTRQDPLEHLTYILGERLYSDKDEGNITEAMFAIARALNRVGAAIENSDHPLMGSTLDEVYSGLAAVALAIEEHGKNGG